MLIADGGKLGGRDGLYLKVRAEHRFGETVVQDVGYFISPTPIGDGQGVECFYNYELTPAIRITPDMQYVVPALRAAEPSLIVGMRALVSF